MSKQFKPVTLIILDGWGHSTNKEHNAIAAANTPYWDHLLQAYPHTLIDASGNSVGLPKGQMGNSEVGHLTMGSGRLIPQDFTRISQAIEDRSFFENAVLINAVKSAAANNKAVHILGLLSPGGVHSHEDHLFAMILLASIYDVPIYVHAILDGRDMPPKSALSSIEKLLATCKKVKKANLASLIGRYYAMDRDNRWDRVEKAYDLLISANAAFSSDSAITALEEAYRRGETDEFVSPISIHSSDEEPATIKDGDVVIHMNYRADRARELSYALTQAAFSSFPRKKTPAIGAYVTLTEYDKGITPHIAFPPITFKNILGELLANHQLPQLRVAETEKYAHVTFFFNGGQETPFEGEDRILIDSPKVATYDLQPEMSAYKVTEEVVNAIKNQHHAVIICNFANADMVGHTGNFSATVKAIAALDACLGKIVEASLAVGGDMIVTADHGNAEKMFDNMTNQAHTAHTTELVPFLYVGNRAKIDETVPNKALSDVAPSMLYLLGLEQPPEMTGHSLLK